MKKSTFRRKPITTSTREDLILGYDSNFALVEAYKTIRTNIMYSMPRTDKKGAKVIAITSAGAGDGKTSTAVNIALTFAQIDAKVLLIDCDLRKPRVHRCLNLERKDGVSNVLCGFAEIDDAIKKNVRENLDVFTSGETPPNPAELIESEMFKKMLDILRQRYDYIFIDTPPVTLVTDALLVIPHCAGTVLSMREGHTTYGMLDDLMETLNKAEANILGTVLICGEEQKSRYAYYRRYKYSEEYHD